MLNLSAKIRDKKEKPENLRQKGVLSAVLYGPKTQNLAVKIGLKEFKEIFQEAGESSLISLEMGDKKNFVLIHDVQFDPLTGEPIHADFLQPLLKEKTEATVSLEFEGEAPAVKELGGTLVKNIQEIEVKALPQDLPHEIRVNIECLKTFEDSILVKDLKVADNVEVLKEPEEVVASVIPAEKVEEELEKPIEEKVEEVEKVEEKKEEEEEKEEKEEKGENA